MGLQIGLECDRVSTLRVRPALCVPPELRVRDVITRMKLRGIGCAFTVDAHGAPRSLFTEASVLRLLTVNPEGLDDPVARYASHHVPSVRETDTVRHLVELMNWKDLRFVAVVDEDGRLVGVTGQKGLMEYVAEHYPSQVLVAKTGPRRCLQREGA